MLRRTLKNNAGFSLVELMVVVAIIGVLASIAVPNVNRYIAKSRRSEAKTNLAGIFSSEQAFNTEYNTFTNNFVAMGFRPTGVLRYSVGFGKTSTVDNAAALAFFNYTGTVGGDGSTGYQGQAAYCGTPTAFTNGCGMAAESRDEKALAGSSAGTAAVTAGTWVAPAAGTAVTHFVAGAAAAIYQSTGLVDSLTIDENKNLLNPIDGIQ